MCKDEENDLVIMKRNANVLEFFQNFYAGFLQILLQTYIFMGHWNGQSLETKPRKFRALSACRKDNLVISSSYQ